MIQTMKDIPGFENYAITTDGRVWRKPSISYSGCNHAGKHSYAGRWLKVYGKKDGHLSVNLRYNGQHVSKCVHRLVLGAWVGPCPKGMECRHLDGNPRNNRLENLEWNTHKINMQDKIKHGVNTGPRCESCARSKLIEAEVKIIRYLRRVGFTLADIAWQFDVTRQNIYAIVHRKTWRSVP